MKLTLSAFLSALLLLGAALPARAATAGPEIIRIKTGITAPLTDEAGIVWRADAGFTDGDTIDRAGLTIANTKTPSLYRAERYAMSAFHWKLPNGKYTVKLHFAETYEDITGPGERVFSFKVGGREFKDFDVCKKAGGVLRAYVETVEVEVRLPISNVPRAKLLVNPQIGSLLPR